MELYVVQATHRDGESAVTSPIIVTENAAVAITAALTAEQLGYRFSSIQRDNILVFRMDTKGMCPPISLSGEHHPESIVLVLTCDPGYPRGWQVSWYDKDLENTYAKVFESLTA